MVDETYALNAAVYTSLADIEGEANGMATYDREVSLAIRRLPLHFMFPQVWFAQLAPQSVAACQIPDSSNRLHN